MGGAPPDASAQLYTYAFGLTPDGKRTHRQRLLGATESIKCGLAAKEKGTDMPSRQVFANFAKDFIDDKLADVVLYGGTYRESALMPSVCSGGALHRDRRQRAATGRPASTAVTASQPSSSPTASAAT